MNKVQLNLGRRASRSLKAFTLAEVLITLAIIGVVAALTIPSVVTNYQNQERIAALKKTYSALANTTNLAISEHGAIETWEVATRLEGAVNFVDKYMIPYLKIQKKCGIDRAGICALKNYSYLNESTPGHGSERATNFVLADGTVVVSSTYYAEPHKRVYLWVDVNGSKGPNVLGKDIFDFSYFIAGYGIQNGKLLPPGINRTMNQIIAESSSGCNKNASGEFCGALIIRNGWKIPNKDEYVKMAGGNEEYRALYPW
ncbi:MAG: type II secretion system protein [Cyanobacteria bacterium SIG30]|nr:type II secretion system protein [Cyanobacteria bacterium SIG30]